MLDFNVLATCMLTQSTVNYTCLLQVQSIFNVMHTSDGGEC